MLGEEAFGGERGDVEDEIAGFGGDGLGAIFREVENLGDVLFFFCGNFEQGYAEQDGEEPRGEHRFMVNDSSNG